MKYAVPFLLFLSSMAIAQDFTYEIKITNITKSQVISPPVAASHYRGVAMFTPGQPVSEAFATMAEDGMNGDLAAELEGVDLIYDVAASEEFLMPGASQTLTVQTTGYFNRISVVGMLVTTNDAFFALDSAEVYTFRFKRGGLSSTRHFGYVWDAGTEVNSEDCATIPGPPCGSEGVRDTEGAEGYVYPHPGLHGEGDLTLSGHNWSGPAVMIEITRVIGG